MGFLCGSEEEVNAAFSSQIRHPDWRYRWLYVEILQLRIEKIKLQLTKTHTHTHTVKTQMQKYTHAQQRCVIEAAGYIATLNKQWLHDGDNDNESHRTQEGTD